MIEPKEIPYKDFPASPLKSDGMKELEMQPAGYRCRTHTNVIYAVKDGVELPMHIIEPTVESWEDARDFPVVVFVQGSAWMKQHIGSELTQLARFASRGYAIAIPEYRHTGIAPFPAQLIDIKTAVRYIMEHGKDYSADTSQLYIWGDSSGAHTANMVNITSNEPDYNEPDETTSIQVKACIDFYGPVNIMTMNDEPSIQNHLEPDSPEGRLIGFKQVDAHPELAALTNPANHVKAGKDIKPTLIIHGDKDRLVPFGQSIILYEALKNAGIPVEFYKLKGADHAGKAFWTEQILDIVEDFMKRESSKQR